MATHHKKKDRVPPMVTTSRFAKPAKWAKPPEGEDRVAYYARLANVDINQNQKAP